MLVPPLDGDKVNPLTYEDAVYWGNGGYPLVTGRVVNTDTRHLYRCASERDLF
jgi:hypothetical protein